jgi:hypothetical protein
MGQAMSAMATASRELKEQTRTSQTAIAAAARELKDAIRHQPSRHNSSSDDRRRGSSSNRQTTTSRNNSPRQSTTGSRAPIVCYRCGGENHMSRDCPQKPKPFACFRCGDTSHGIARCPQAASTGSNYSAPRSNSSNNQGTTHRRQQTNPPPPRNTETPARGGSFVHPQRRQQIDSPSNPNPSAPSTGKPTGPAVKYNERPVGSRYWCQNCHTITHMTADCWWVCSLCDTKSHDYRDCAVSDSTNPAHVALYNKDDDARSVRLANTRSGQSAQALRRADP